jgi:hypothetical protein
MSPYFYGDSPQTRMYENRGNAGAPMATTPECQKQKHPSCAPCGKHMSLLDSFLGPRSGNQVRTFKCDVARWLG